MTTLTPSINSFRNDEHVAAEHKIDAFERDFAIPTAFTSVIITNAWMFATAYSIFHYVVAVCLMRINGATDTAFISECKMLDGDDETAETPNGSSNTCLDASLEELMASDRRGVECEALGIFERNLTKPFGTLSSWRLTSCVD